MSRPEVCFILFIPVHCTYKVFTAIDIWSAGIVMLSFLTGKFPLFQSNDDVEALMEIASIIGRRRMEAAATLHSKCCASQELHGLLTS